MMWMGEEDGEEDDGAAISLITRRSLLAGISLVLVGGKPAVAQSVSQFYSERTITLLVASAAGGVNDLVGRLIAKHLGNFIPGKPDIIVQNLGSAGIVLGNRLYSDEPKDGSVIAMLERSTPQLAVAGNPNVQFDPLKLTWIGSVSSYANDAYILEVNASFPAKTIADLGFRAVRSPGSGPRGLDRPMRSLPTFAGMSSS